MFCFRPDLVAVMTNIGNSMANTIWEANLKGRLKPAPNAPRWVKIANATPPASVWVLWSWWLLTKDDIWDKGLTLITCGAYGYAAPRCVPSIYGQIILFCREEKEKWIRAKYEQKEFLPPPPYLDVPLSQVSKVFFIFCVIIKSNKVFTCQFC